MTSLAYPNSLLPRAKYSDQKNDLLHGIWNNLSLINGTDPATLSARNVRGGMGTSTEDVLLEIFAELSAMAVPLKNRLNQVVNVKDFGAIGDGINDDRASIQAAVDYAKFCSIANGGNVRIEVFFPYGIYRINTTPINCTNINGLSLRGAGGKYVNTHIEGNTGAQIFDCTGATMMEIDGFTFVGNKNNSNPSTIGVQFTLSQDLAGVQIGGLNNSINNCYFQLDDIPTANAGYGTIGLLNVRSEEFSASNLVIRASLPMVFSYRGDFNSTTGKNLNVTSQFAIVATGTGSMGNIDLGANISLQNYEKRSSALLLLSTNSFRFFGYIGRITNTLGSENCAISLFGQNDNINISATIESFSQIARLGTQATNVTLDIVTASQVDPSLPVIDITGTALRDSTVKVSFNNPAEYNNGRMFIYHALVNSGNSAATGMLINCLFSCSGWVDNALFVSANSLKNCQNSRFNSGQPFEKVNGAVVDKKSYTILIGTIAAGNPELQNSIIRFKRADKATTTTGNGGVYEARIKGVLIAGDYNANGKCVVSFQAVLPVTQDSNGTPVAGGVSYTLLSKIGNSAYLDITQVTPVMDFSGGTIGAVRLYVKNAGTGIGQPIYFNGVVELISDFAVNQSVIFN